jgi:hypothetical protein
VSPAKLANTGRTNNFERSASALASKTPSKEPRSDALRKQALRTPGTPFRRESVPLFQLLKDRESGIISDASFLTGQVRTPSPAQMNAQINVRSSSSSSSSSLNFNALGAHSPVLSPVSQQEANDLSARRMMRATREQEQREQKERRTRLLEQRQKQKQREEQRQRRAKVREEEARAKTIATTTAISAKSPFGIYSDSSSAAASRRAASNNGSRTTRVAAQKRAAATMTTTTVSTDRARRVIDAQRRRFSSDVGHKKRGGDDDLDDDDLDTELTDDQGNAEQEERRRAQMDSKSFDASMALATRRQPLLTIDRNLLNNAAAVSDLRSIFKIVKDEQRRQSGEQETSRRLSSQRRSSSSSLVLDPNCDLSLLGPDSPSSNYSGPISSSFIVSGI